MPRSPCQVTGTSVNCHLRVVEPRGISTRTSFQPASSSTGIGSRRGKSSSWSGSTAVTDGKTVWFTFGTGTVVAYDFTGKELWRRELEKDYGEIMVQYGYSSSPLLYKGKLYFVIMQSKAPNAYKTYRKEQKKGPRDLLASVQHELAVFDRRAVGEQPLLGRPRARQIDGDLLGQSVLKARQPGRQGNEHNEETRIR